LLALALSVLIEVAQLLVLAGRDPTVGDVVANTLGGALGFGLIAFSPTWLRPSRRQAIALLVCWGAAWLCIQAVSNFGFTFSLPASQYYGQLSRPMGRFVAFRGTVLGASAADIPLPDALIPASENVRRVLLNGSALSAMVLPAGAPSGIAPIVRIADAGQHEIALLAQEDRSLVATIRSGATALRLRRPLYSLARAFPVTGHTASLRAADTLRVFARFRPGAVTVASVSRSYREQSRIQISAALGWTLLMPFDRTIEGTMAERVASMAWIALLLAPIGYWARRFAAQGRAPVLSRALMGLFTVSLLATGLVLVPRIFGLPSATFTEIIAALCGIWVGALAPSVTLTTSSNA
jgi:hypothetical protein